MRIKEHVLKTWMLVNLKTVVFMSLCSTSVSFIMQMIPLLHLKTMKAHNIPRIIHGRKQVDVAKLKWREMGHSWFRIKRAESYWWFHVAAHVFFSSLPSTYKHAFVYIYIYYLGFIFSHTQAAKTYSAKRMQGRPLFGPLHVGSTIDSLRQRPIMREEGQVFTEIYMHVCINPPKSSFR